MKPLSPEAIKRMALAHGAKAEIDGLPVNAARTQVAVAPAPKPAYMPEVPATPKAETIAPAMDNSVRTAVESIDRYAASNFLLGEANVNLMNVVKDTLQKMGEQQQPDQRPTRWVFNVKRDNRGLMERIEAVAQFK